eukprot:5022841-Prorocentrum_lima.AAC.1
MLWLPTFNHLEEGQLYAAPETRKQLHFTLKGHDQGSGFHYLGILLWIHPSPQQNSYIGPFSSI